MDRIGATGRVLHGNHQNFFAGNIHQVFQHQRGHLCGIGHPVAGDKRYGGLSAPRLMLHAWKLSHPQLGELVAPPPAAIRSPA